MKPDEKYMSQIKIDDDINFVPPSFSTSLFRKDYTDTNNITHKTNVYNTDYEMNNNNSSTDLFPSETEESQLYCYYSSFGDCSEKNDKFNLNMNIPTPSEILRNFDLDLDETTDLERCHSKSDVDKIFAKIEKRNPGILATFASYRIPYPIAKVIIKRIIKLSLLYSDKIR